MAYSFKQYKEMALRHLDYLQGQVDDYTDLEIDARKKIADLKKQHRAVLVKISKLIVPEFTQDSTRQLADLMNDPEIANFPLIFQQEKERLKNEIEAIETNEKYVNRALYIDPQTGEYILAYKEMESAHEEILETFAKYLKRQSDFEELIHDKYGTPDYPHTGFAKYFNSEHLFDWRVADELCEEHGFEDIVDLLNDYKEKKENIEAIRNSMNDYRIKIDEIDNFVKKLEKNKLRLANLKDIYLENLGQAIGAFLNNTSPESIHEFEQKYNDILGSLIKKERGLFNQSIYLEEFRTKLSEEMNSLVNKIVRLNNEVNKISRYAYKHPNRKWEKEKLDKRFKQNWTFINKRKIKYQKNIDTFYGFNNYDRISLSAASIFWWEVITNNKIDNSFSSSARDFYESHSKEDELFEPILTSQNNQDNS
ncbi:MAG: hypothetical protein H6600_08240 [Flavobacteriales bacterium]|nr:hypothetical protein [Flavobacteriales bacterium]MCB9196399.1 hypothetical protein [Flavobacteriales bacterium]MCB9198433.1 hypothetical protein [Flavobacteriales bacterium]